MPLTTRRPLVLVAGLWCTAVAAAALTAHVLWLVLVWMTFEPPADVEGPSVFAFMGMVIMIGGWSGFEAAMAWAAFADALHRPPRRRAAVGLLAGVAALDALLTAQLWSADAAPVYTGAVGAVVPVTLAAAVLIARAPA